MKKKLLPFFCELINTLIALGCFALCLFVHLGEPDFTILIVVGFLLLVWDKKITRLVKMVFHRTPDTLVFTCNGFLITMRKEVYAHSRKSYYKAYYTEFKGGKPRGYSSDCKKRKDCIKEAIDTCKVMIPSTVKWDDL